MLGRPSVVTVLTLPRGARAALALSVLTLLAGCGGGPTDKSDFPPACPQVATVPDAAEVTRFRGAGTDLTDMAMDARITAPRGKCSRDTGGRLRVVTNVRLLVTRGPAASGTTETVDYFIAVLSGGHILAKYPQTATVEFPPNVDHLVVTGDNVVLSLPTTKDKPGDAFTLVSGFQLTPAQLAFNRQRDAQ